jgi:alkylated DNA repair dioxygenase AlkB
MASLYFETLSTDVPWRHDSITVYNKVHVLPRLQQWYGDPGQKYSWSGIELNPLPWTDTLQQLREKVQDEFQYRITEHVPTWR